MTLQRWLILIGLTGFGLFLYFAWDEIIEALQLIRTADWRWLILIVPLQGFNYLTKAWFYQGLFRYIGYNIPARRLFGLSWALMFVNTTFPSGGLSTLSLFGVAMKQDGIPLGKTSLVQFARYTLNYVSFLFVLLFGITAMYFGPEIEQIAIRITILIGLVIIVLGVVSLFTVYDKRILNWSIRKLQQGIDWMSRRFRSGKNLIGRERVERLLHEFHDGFRRVMKLRIYLKQPFGWALLGNLIEITIFYLIFVSVGYVINPGVVIITYAIASATGFISFIPGDIGVYEAAMITVLSLAGVPLAVGVSVTLMYRVLVKTLFLTVGFYYYTRHIKEF